MLINLLMILFVFQFAAINEMAAATMRLSEQTHGANDLIVMKLSGASTLQQKPLQTQSADNLLTYITEDSLKRSLSERCINLIGVEKYTEIPGALSQSWSFPTLASVRSHLRATSVIL